MTQPPHQSSSDLPCSTILYRTIRQRDWLDPDDASRVKAEAFMRRRPRLKPDGELDAMDGDGLSVFDANCVKPEGCVQESRRCFGVASLHVGTLRDKGLAVVRDPIDQRKALIVNLPFENPNSAEEEALLDVVAETARIVLRGNFRKRD